MNTTISHLLERRLEAVSYDADTKEWIFGFTGKLALQISSPWRLLSSEGIAVGWQDHSQRFGLASPVDVPQRIRALVGSAVIEMATYDEVGDLAVRFESGTSLQVFNASSGYEGWILNGPGKRWVVAQGGGRVVDSKAHD